MAQGTKSGGSSGRPPGGSSGSKQGGGSGQRPVKRQSVAAARKSGSNRTQLILGGVAIVLIVAVIVVGLVLNHKNNAVQDAGYGHSTNSVASISTGVEVVQAGGTATPAVTLDFYEDALCPICQQFETQFGQQISKAVDNGQLKARYHMLNFLDPHSHSGDYSTRAAAALMCVAQKDGTKPGLWMQYHSLLYSDSVQPKEGGSSDLSNEELAQKAASVGVSQDAQTCISTGANVDLAKSEATKSESDLQTAIGGVATPTVLQDGKPVSINNVNWLADLLAQK